MALGGFAFLALSNDPYSNSLWYSFKHGVGFSEVHTDAKPTDCDFLTAPLGNKNCGYEPQVGVLNADGVVVTGDGAPTFAADTTTGKPILSYDGGKNWHWYTGPNP